MVKIYVDGKQVTKEELKNIEIKKESVKRILSERLKKDE